MTRRVVCPGSFDPVTKGHLDVIGRAAELFDEVVVAVGVNVAKTRLFTAVERIEMLRTACSPWPAVSVRGFEGLLTTFCAEQGAVAIVKGIRGAHDMDFERQMAQMNSHLTGIQTVFLPASRTLGFVSSSLVKEVAGLGGDVSEFLPDFVNERLVERLGRPG
jgi:pantetheine-phosphate adenylyltransferase